MKSKEQIQLEQGFLSQSEKDKIEIIISALQHFVSANKINVEEYNSLVNIEREVWCLREGYTKRLLNLLKQGTIV